MNEGTEIDGRYRLEQKLGQGGMGQVFQGYDKELAKTVAIKILFPNTPDSTIKRFHTEAIALAQLKHPNILTVQHFGQSTTGTLYLVTDFIEGISLNSVIESRGAQNFFEVLPIFEKVCRGLRFAHSKNVLHRDIKPSNVMLELDHSKDDSVKLVDFGLAKTLDKDFDLTKTGSAMGTPAYMSPEAIHGKESDARSDIYSLGCTLFELLTGKPPFGNENGLQAMMAHINSPPPSLSETTGKQYDPEVEAFVRTCLEKDPKNRFQNMDELTAQLEAVEQTLLSRQQAAIESRGPAYNQGLLDSKEKELDKSFLQKSLFLTLIGAIGCLATGYFLLHAAENKPLENREEARREFNTDTTKIEAREEARIGKSPRTRSGVVYEHIPERAAWCRIIGRLTDDELFEKLESCNNEPNVALENLTVSGEALDRIFSLPIKRLVVFEIRMTESLLKRIANLQGLTWLNVTGSGELPPGFAKQLNNGKLKTLTFEMLQNNAHPGDDLVSIRTLQSITFCKGHISRSDIKKIVRGLDLHELNFVDCTFAPDALADLQQAKNCNQFVAERLKLTDRQFEDISKLPSIQRLGFKATNIDDDTLKHFRRCKQLQKVLLPQSAVTPTGVAMLKASVPAANVHLVESAEAPF